MRNLRSLTAAALLAAACGSSERPETTEPSRAAEPVPAEGAPAEKHGHGKLTPELEKFHGLLSPRWHAEKGEARRNDTCGALAELETAAGEVAAADPPERVEPAAWTGAASALQTSVDELGAACDSKDMARFDTAFEAVHTRFHRAMELVVGEHDMQGKHGDEHPGHGQHGGATHGEGRDTGH